MFVWLHIARCLNVKMLLLKEKKKQEQLYVCLARHCQMSIFKAATGNRLKQKAIECLFG